MDFDLISPIISHQENLDLIKKVFSEEIKSAVFHLAPDKTSGPDGFPSYFLQ